MMGDRHELDHQRNSLAAAYYLVNCPHEPDDPGLCQTAHRIEWAMPPRHVPRWDGSTYVGVRGSWEPLHDSSSITVSSSFAQNVDCHHQDDAFTAATEVQGDPS